MLEGLHSALDIYWLIQLVFVDFDVAAMEYCSFVEWKTVKYVLETLKYTYKAFHGFGHTKLAYGGLIFGSSRCTVMPHLPLKTMLELN